MGAQLVGVCDLDRDNQGFGSHTNQTTDSMVVYARFKNGNLEKRCSLEQSINVCRI